MRAPDFWSRRPATMLARTLAPLGRCYTAATASRIRRAPAYRAPVPVVCVGNICAGGAGKTPIAIDLATRLTKAGIAVHILSRGYGGNQLGPLRVDPRGHSAREVGDEPLLLAHAAPTWVARHRAEGAEAAVAAGAAALLLDDGFQDPALAKDLSLVVVDGSRGFGNGLGIPAGPLREEVAAGLERAGAIVLVGADHHGIERLAERAKRPLLRARLHPVEADHELAGKRVYAFAGIGDPEKFLGTLEMLGAKIAGSRAFGDHHRFGEREAEAILDRARALHALPVTTEKDAVRLPPEVRTQVRTVGLKVIWDDKAALTELVLAPFLGSR